MSTVNVPQYMNPVESLVTNGGVEVLNEPRRVTDQDGNVKTAEAFPGRTPYKVTVDVLRGSRMKELPDGDSMEVFDYRPLNVTVWSETVPDVVAGDYVVFDQLMIGAFDSNLFYQAVSVEKAAGF